MTTRIILALALVFGLGIATRAQDADAVRKLIARLKEKDISERRLALVELQKLGPKHADAVPALIEAFSNPSAETRQLVVNILGNIGKPAVPELSKALKGRTAGGPPAGLSGPGQDRAECEGRRAGAGGLPGGRQGPGNPRVCGGRPRPDRSGRQGRAAATGATLKEEKESNVRLTVLFALEEPARKNPKLAPVIASGLRDRDKEVRIAAAAVLSRLGDNAREAVPALTAALQDKDADVRTTAAHVLAEVDPSKTATAVPVLVQALKSASANTRRSASFALGQIGPPAKTAVEQLATLAKSDASAEVRQAAAAAVEKIRRKQ